VFYSVTNLDRQVSIHLVPFASSVLLLLENHLLHYVCIHTYSQMGLFSSVYTLLLLNQLLLHFCEITENNY